MVRSRHEQPQLPPIVDLYPCPRCGADVGQACIAVEGVETLSVAVIHPERIPPERYAGASCER
jgi:hypothetical protein